MKNKKGFTLVEIIAVVAIIAIVGGLFAVNMTSKNKDNSTKEEAIATIKAAAQAYLSLNEDTTEKLNNGYSYIDIPISALADAGLIDESVVNDYGNSEGNVRVSIQDLTEENSVTIFELDDENGNMNTSNPYHIVAEDQIYNTENAPNNICSDTSKAKVVDEHGNKQDITISISKCNYEKKEGTYNVTYNYDYNGMKGSKTVSVSVLEQNKLNSTIIINNGNSVAYGTALTSVPVTIIEQRSSNLSNNIINTTLQGLKDGISGYTVTNTADITTTPTMGTILLIGGSYTPITKNITVKHSELADQTASYTITKSSPEISNVNGYIQYNSGYAEKNYIKYSNNNTIFRIYNIKKSNNIISVITNSDYGTKTSYGFVAPCSWSCCNSGRYSPYIWIGSSEVNLTRYNWSSSSVYARYTLAYPYMHTVLNNFGSLFNSSTGIPSYAIITTFYQNSLSSASSSSKSSYIGLLSLAEYKAIACNNTNSCNNSYITSGKNDFWLLDGSGSSEQVNNYVASNTGFKSISTTAPYGEITSDFKIQAVRPVMNLQNVKIIGGTGLVNDPYIMN